VAIDRFDSLQATVNRLARLQGEGAVAVIRLDKGGVVGRHQTVRTQLFVVVDGAGVVSGEDGVDVPIAMGQAALWQQGEFHESRTDTGMTAVVIEIDDVQQVT
jgi:mannose-6-phosphate isomerase-like protein (cupin superfamily)